MRAIDLVVTLLAVLPSVVWKTAPLTFSQSVMESFFDTCPRLAVAVTHRLFEKSLTSALFKQWRTLICWSCPFQIWIVRSPLHVDLWCVFSRRSSRLPGWVPCWSHHFPFGQIWRSHQPSSLFPSVVVYQLDLTTTISIPATWALLSTIMKILTVLNQRIFNQQSLRHCLL